MKNNLIKAAALLLVTAIVCPLILCSCSYKAIPPSEDDMIVVGQVEGIDVHKDELRFVTDTYRRLLIARYGEGIFEGEDRAAYLSMLKELVYANITANYAVILLCGEVKINLGEEAVLEKVEERMAELVDELGGVSKYKKYLSENCLTDRLLRFNTEVDLLQNELMYVYVEDILLIENDDEKIYDIIMSDFIGVKHIFVSHSTENAQDKINTALSRLNNGESFAYVLEEFDEDEDMTSDGLYIPRGYMTERYDEVAFSLDVGETSDIVEDEHGYYIITRTELSTLTVLQRFDYLKSLYQSYTFLSIIDKKQAELVFVPTEAGESFMADPF